jgi:hypothetical protein
MAPPQSSPDLLPHIRVVVSIIVGLCITTLLNGFARFVQHPAARKSPSSISAGLSLFCWP